MLECVIVGDSIGVGTHAKRPECVSYAKGGINTWQWNKQFGNKDLSAGTVIISLGTNDHKYVKTQQELETMRARVRASRVFWVLPYGNLKGSEVPIERIQQTVKDIAARYGDTVLPITRISSDGIHPSWAGYKELAEKTK